MSEPTDLSCRLAQLRISRDDVQCEENDRSLLGKGSYGKVYRGRYRQRDVAVKNLHRIFFELAGEACQDDIIAELTKECELLSCLRHDNIVRLYGVVNAGSPRMCMVTELMDGSLDKLYPASPPLTRCDELDIAWSVSNALLYLHTYRPHPIIHRDLAPKNMLYKEDGEQLLVKVADVGLAKVVETSRLTSGVAGSVCPGTQNYMPPEVLVTRGRPSYGTSLDVFSFGVSMVEMIVCNRPSVLQTQRAADLEEVGERGHPLHGLLKLCFSDNPPQRPTAARVLDVVDSLRRQDWYATMSNKQHIAHTRYEESSRKHTWRNKYYKMVEDRITELETENRSLNSRKAELEAENRDLITIQAELKAENSSLNSRQTQFEAENRELSARQAQLEVENWHLKNRQAELDSGIKQGAERFPVLVNASTIDSLEKTTKEEISKEDCASSRTNTRGPRAKVFAMSAKRHLKCMLCKEGLAAVICSRCELAVDEECYNSTAGNPCIGGNKHHFTSLGHEKRFLSLSQGKEEKDS